MNEQKKPDFFPSVGDADYLQSAPEIRVGYVETDEDKRHEARLNLLAEQIDELLDAQDNKQPELGELPDDASGDEKRWNELEQDFESAFDAADNR